MSNYISFTRRRAVALIAGAASLPMGHPLAAEVITVHKDPNCGCCNGWVAHLREAGFSVNTVETGDIEALKMRLGVPADLAACHTAQVSGYLVEGHVSADALKRF